MTREETKALLRYFGTAYGKAFDLSDLTAKIDLWHQHFQSTPHELMNIAAQQYVRENRYPPNIAGLIQQLELLEDNDGIDEMWEQICKAARNSTSKEAYEALPEVCKKFVGGIRGLKELGQMDAETFQTVTRGQWYRQGPNLVKREKAVNSIPADIREKLHGLKMIGGIDEYLDGNR